VPGARHPFGSLATRAGGPMALRRRLTAVLLLLRMKRVFRIARCRGEIAKTLDREQPLNVAN